MEKVGDGVMAVFPAGDDAGAAARRAVSAAFETIDSVLRPPTFPDDPALDCSIGLALGEVVYGNVGSRERLDFTIVGSAANLASRLCELGKSMGRRIVATEDVAQAAGGFDSMGPVQLRGVPAAISVHGA